MKLKELYPTEQTYDRAVSPVVGVALLIAIAVILATVIGVVVLDIGPGGANTPQAEMAGNYYTDAGGTTYLNVSHNGGDPMPADEVYFADESGTQVYIADTPVGERFTAGETIALNETETGLQLDSEEIKVIWEDPGSDKEIILAGFEP